MYNGKDFKKRLALATGMTQSQIAEAIGVNQQTIVMWGENVPSGKTLLKLHEAFGVSIDYLFGIDSTSKSISDLKFETEELKLRLHRMEEALRNEGLEI